MTLASALADLGDRFRGRRNRTGKTGHLLIAGTGRAGTTLLVRIFTRLGLDTGFTAADIAEVDGNVGRAGLEHPISRETAPTLPAIIKSPLVVDVLDDGLRQGWLPVDCAIIPIRKLSDAASSRRAVRERAIEQGMKPEWAPGGLWKTDDPEAQEPVLAVQLYLMLEALVAADVPTTLVSFPRHAKDPDYFVRKIGPVLDERFGVTAGALRAAHAAETRTDYIGSYS